MNKKANSITITYLTKVSLASLNGGDSDADNINAIKKVTLPNGDQLPYMSSQAIRHGLRDKFAEFGETLSPISLGEDKKGTAKGSLEPEKYIDDDLMGFMSRSFRGDKNPYFANTSRCLSGSIKIPR
ncbi:MAG: hypothetical protein U5N85_14665 [Arcicella sp.]|nr:hypothetical protein [Arcicella sp.]